MSKNKNTDTIKITPTIGGKPLKSRPFSKSKSAGPMKSRDYKFDKKKKGGMSDTNKKVIPLMPTGVIYKGKAKDYPGIKKIIKDKYKKAKGGSTEFGMLSVKAGIDKNPKATQADRIAGATMKKKSGGMVESRGQKSIQVKKVPFRGIY